MKSPLRYQATDADCNLGVMGYYRGTSAHSLAFVAEWCRCGSAATGWPR